MINLKVTERDRQGRRRRAGRSPGDQLILITQEGMIIRTAVDGIREIGRSTQGVRLINLEGDDRLVAIAKVLERDDDNGEPGGPAAGPDDAGGSPAEPRRRSTDGARG